MHTASATEPQRRCTARQVPRRPCPWRVHLTAFCYPSATHPICSQARTCQPALLFPAPAVGTGLTTALCLVVESVLHCVPHHCWAPGSPSAPSPACPLSCWEHRALGQDTLLRELASMRLRGSSVTRFLGHRHQRPACRPRKPNPSLQAPSSIAAPPPQGHMRPPSVPQLWHRPCDSRYLSGWPSRTEGCSPAMRGPQHHTQDRHLSLRELAGGSLAFWGPGAFLLRVGPSPSLVDVLGPREKLLGPPVVTLAIG